jgi:hypothetical protein
MTAIKQIEKDLETGRIVAVEGLHFVRQLRYLEQGIIGKRMRKPRGKILAERIDVEGTISVCQRNFAVLLKMKIGILAAIY